MWFGSMSEIGGRRKVCAAPYRGERRTSPHRVGRAEAEPNMASNLERFWSWARRWERSLTPYKRTEITVETDHVLIVRRRRSVRAWCRQCGHEVDMVGLAEAEASTGISGPQLRNYAESRGWHLFQNDDGCDLICLESWLKSA